MVDLLAEGQGIPVEAVEQDGCFSAAIVEVLCRGCGETIRGKIELADGEVESEIGCPVCSERMGVAHMIPVVILVGQEVADTLEEEEGLGSPDQDGVPEGLRDGDEDGPPFIVKEHEVADGQGPLELVSK